MAYQHEQYGFTMPQMQQQTMYFPHQMQYAGFPQQHLQSDMIPHAYAPFTDFPEAFYYTDFDDPSEVTTRPRLTKEQVDILEGEFQRNSKPNSGTKRHLAQITNLNLPRVANWFQNRRAKAKQQRKQEEFESAQKQMASAKQNADEKRADNDDEEDEDEDEQEVKSRLREQRSDKAQLDNKPKIESSTPPSRSPERSKSSVSARERADASLRRALAAAEAQRQLDAQIMNQDQRRDMPASEPPKHHIVSPFAQSRTQAQAISQLAEWSGASDAQGLWLPSPAAGGDMPFDFGFGAREAQMLNEQAILPSPAESTSQGFHSPEAWENLATPTMANGPHGHLQQTIPSPGIPMSSYVGSRRPSIADTLTSNFGGIDIANSQVSFASDASSNGSEGVDLASRRRRPRPAALTSASLRSRSYGALASPTIRPGMTPPTAQTLRHVKSTGHSLNNHYAGIRKSSMPQKSPLAYSFAEAEAFKQLMAQKAMQMEPKQQLGSLDTTPMTLGSTEERNMNGVPRPAQIPANVMGVGQGTQIQSPPVTPYNQNFFGQTPSMLAQSIHQQYASVSETPPYSAGPMTNTSWDFPLTSPDVANFPQTSLLPTLPLTSSTGEEAALNPWMCSADQSSMYGGATPNGGKDAEWYIHEFPNQKEELAQTAKLLDRPAPKHYAFENRGQRDFAL